jgi:hypothetical protein
MKSAAVLSAACLLAAALPAGAAIKCWTNKEGVRECGEKVPPEYAQGEQEVRNEQGMVTDKTERARTAEEIAKAEQEAAAAAEAKRLADEKAHQDRVLLATFTSVQDIERVRDEQVRSLESSITVTRKRNEKIQQDLDKRIASAAAEERAGKQPNESLLKDIESLRRQVAANDEFVAAKQKEQDQIRADYDQRIQRFNELKGAQGAVTP